MKKYTFILCVLVILSGCATLNFSSKYTTLPTDYKKDIDEVWNNIISNTSLKYKTYYKNLAPNNIRIVNDKATTTPGIPQIKDGIIYLPEYFIKYIWEFYYPKYHKQILTCVILHELSHPETGLPDSPPETHFSVDYHVIRNLLPKDYDVNTYYSSLVVVQQYWKARKGTTGHLANIGWNILNTATFIYAGSGYIGDLFSTDISRRIELIHAQYHNLKFVFKRSK